MKSGTEGPAECLNQLPGCGERAGLGQPGPVAVARAASRHTHAFEPRNMGTSGRGFFVVVAAKSWRHGAGVPGSALLCSGDKGEDEGGEARDGRVWTTKNAATVAPPRVGNITTAVFGRVLTHSSSHPRA